MVQRIETQGLTEFEGIVEKVESTPGLDGRRQFHLVINPTSFKVGGVTERLHEWLPMSDRATEDTVPTGSVMDRYLTQVEIVLPIAKKEKTIKGALNLLIGKKFLFNKIKLGKAFEGHPARDYAVPVKLL